MQHRIGVFGGTFDPIHYGHLAAAVSAMHLAQLDRMIFVPAGEPPHKQDRDLSPAHHRLSMVRLATADHPSFAVSSVEMETPGPHYTVRTLERLAALFPDAALHFVTGLDGLVNIQRWYAYRELLINWPFIGVTRPGVELRAWERVCTALGTELVSRVRIIQVPGVAVSSHQLQDLVRAGHPITYLVPPAVEAYIQQHRLYW